MKWHWDNFLSPYTRFQTHAQQMRQNRNYTDTFLAPDLVKVDALNAPGKAEEAINNYKLAKNC
jgi:hypothetical protein